MQKPKKGRCTQEERFLKRYLEYARSKCAPRLSESAAELLIHEYVELREEVRISLREEDARSSGV